MMAMADTAMMVAVAGQAVVNDGKRHMMRTWRGFKQWMCGVVLSVLSGAMALAAPFDNMVVFGDSLSDVGNISQVTAGLQPGRHYYQGRVSNGPVFAEQLAVKLGLARLIPSAQGGTGFAYGGAQTSGTAGLAGLVIHDVDEQVDDYLQGGSVSEQTLHVVFAGANDLINGQTDVQIPVNNLLRELRRLENAGARQFLVSNLPLLGATPRFNADASAAQRMNGRSVQFNGLLADLLDEFVSSHPEVQLYRLDMAASFAEITSNPARFGLVNVTDPAAPGLTPGSQNYDITRIVADPDEYLFWDDLHPTRAAHMLMADYAAQAVTEPAGLAAVVFVVFVIRCRHAARP